MASCRRSAASTVASLLCSDPAGLNEEGVDRIISSSRGFVAGAAEEVVDRSPPPMVLSISNLDASVASMGFVAWLVSVWFMRKVLKSPFPPPLGVTVFEA